MPSGGALTSTDLCRLRYGGSASTWGFALYLASSGRYQDQVLPTGHSPHVGAGDPLGRWAGHQPIRLAVLARRAHAARRSRSVVDCWNAEGNATPAADLLLCCERQAGDLHGRLGHMGCRNNAG